MSARKIITASLTALALTLTLATAPADAHLTRPRLFSFPTAGVSGVGAASVDQATGDVYVGGLGSTTVAKFNASGVPQGFTYPEMLQSSNFVPPGVAVDNSGGPSKGDVYVTTEAGSVFKLESSGNEVAGFTPIGGSAIPSGDVGSEGIFPWGVAVDPANGDVVVEDQGHDEVDIFSESGSFISQFKGGSYGVAVGAHSAGGSVIFTSGEEGVQQWSPSDGYTTPTTVASGFIVGVTVDLATGHIFADEFSQIGEYDSSGALLAHFGSGDFPASLAVTINESSNTVYTGEYGGAGPGKMYVYGPSVVVADVVTGAPATNVASTTASVNGSVNPVETTVTGCRFEYGLSNSYGATSPCTASPPPLTGNAPITEAANLMGLQPNQTYHYRLVAVDVGGASYGEDETFVTPAAAPSLDDESVSGLTQTSVILNGSVNPNNQETTYHFDFGSSAAYGTVLPSPDGSVGGGFGDVPVGQNLSGLTPGTTYHFRLVATNATGTSTGIDETFTTLPLTPPLVSTEEASGISASTGTISGSVNPQGVPTTYEFDLGVDTGYGTRIFGEAGSGIAAQGVSVNLVELTPNTTYHYRLIAMNSFGTSYGQDRTFTTPVVAGALLTGPASAPLIPAPPFPEPAVVAPKKAKASSTAKSARVRTAGSRVRRRAKHGRIARRVRRSGHAHASRGVGR